MLSPNKKPKKVLSLIGTSILSICISFITSIEFSYALPPGKTYVYEQFQPDVDVKQSVTITVAPDGKSYEATIFSGKYQYTCEKGAIGANGTFDETPCGSIKIADEKDILVGTEELLNERQTLGGTLTEPERRYMVRAPDPQGWDSEEKVKTTYFHNPQPVAQKTLSKTSKSAKPKDKLPPVCKNVSQTFVGDTEYLYQPYLGYSQKQYLVIKLLAEKKFYKAKIWSGKNQYKCEKGLVESDGTLAETECDPVSLEEESIILAGSEQLDNRSQTVSGSMLDPKRSLNITKEEGQASQLEYATKEFFFVKPRKMFRKKLVTNSNEFRDYCLAETFEAQVKSLREQLQEAQIKHQDNASEYRLRQLKKLRDADLITQEEFERKKKDILSEL